MTVELTEPFAPSKPPRNILIVFAALHFAFFFASLIAIPILAPGSRIPNPFGSDVQMRTFFLTAASAIRLSDFLQFASALCLAALSPLLSDALPSANGPSFSRLTLAGGLGAAIMLSLSALFSWTIVSPGAADLGPALHAFQFLPFLFGGPGWAGFFAIFLAGLAMGTHGILPKWLTGTGYFLACVSALATPVLLTILVSPCLPIARFLGFIWLIITTIYLARQTRPA